MLKQFMGLMVVLFFAVGFMPVTAGDKGGGKVASIYAIKAKGIDGKEVDFSKYKGKVLLIVNVASECGYTSQYAQLQALHMKYADKGLAVLGFPSNDFGGQEPGTEEQIKAFCKKNYGVTFDMFSKVSITGKEPSPVYQHLTSKITNPKHAGKVGWNFEKFLIGRDGTIVNRYASDADLESPEFVQAIEAELRKK